MFTSEDGAGRWRRVSQPEVAVHSGFPIAADERHGKTAWVVPRQSDQERTPIGGGLFVGRTSDGGATWQTFRDGRVCFGTTTGNVSISEDDGERWSCLGHHLPPVHSVHFA